MVASARDVAAVLRDRQPGLPVKKLHKLLYYCQGHHLATFDAPLFEETISAWDMGPVVGTLWHDEKTTGPRAGHADLTEAELNTIGYVLSRYGALTGNDLEHLTHSESPWRRADQARRPGESVRIRPEWIREYFTTAGAADLDDDGDPVDSATVTAWLRDAPSRRPATDHIDTVEDIRARAARHD